MGCAAITRKQCGLPCELYLLLHGRSDGGEYNKVILTFYRFGRGSVRLIVALSSGLSAAGAGNYDPAAGTVDEKVSRFMLLMLFLTLAWLLHVVYVQSGTGFTVRLIFYALLFWFILWLRDFSSHLEYEQLSAQSRARAIRWFNVFFCRSGRVAVYRRFG